MVLNKSTADVSTRCHCYSLRRLNPFRGVTQVLATADARAISPDGRHWEIHVLAEKPADMWGTLNPGEPIQQFLRFGTWNRQQGLRRIPAHPLLDFSTMLAAAEHLLRQLAQQQEQLPFPLEDRFECWLLDNRDKKPLALVASCTRKEETDSMQSGHWHCAARSGKDFPSRKWDLHAPPHPRDTNPHPHMSALDRLIANRTGPALARWFERDDTGAGRIVTSGEEQADPPAVADFPPCLIREGWEDPFEQQLVADYLAWLAPYLLTLQTLSDNSRKRWEQLAGKRAKLLADIWHLYPKIIDQQIIDTARVEARLRRSY